MEGFEVLAVFEFYLFFLFGLIGTLRVCLTDVTWRVCCLKVCGTRKWDFATTPLDRWTWKYHRRRCREAETRRRSFRPNSKICSGEFSNPLCLWTICFWLKSSFSMNIIYNDLLATQAFPWEFVPSLCMEPLFKVDADPFFFFFCLSWKPSEYLQNACSLIRFRGIRIYNLEYVCLHIDSNSWCFTFKVVSYDTSAINYLVQKIVGEGISRFYIYEGSKYNRNKLK